MQLSMPSGRWRICKHIPTIGPLTNSEGTLKRTYPVFPSRAGRAHTYVCVPDQRSRDIQQKYMKAQFAILGKDDVYTYNVYQISIAATLGHRTKN